MATAALRARYLQEFNDKSNFPFVYTSTMSPESFCKFCESTFSGSQKELFRQHMKRAKHKQNIELKKKRTATQALLTELPDSNRRSKSDAFASALCKGMLSTNIPIKKLENEAFRGALEAGCGFKLPSEAAFRRKYLPDTFDHVLEGIKKDLQVGPVWISADCSRDVKGREVTNVVVGRLDSEAYHKSHLMHVTFSDRADSGRMARTINYALRKLDPQFNGNRARENTHLQLLLCQKAIKYVKQDAYISV